MSECGDAHPETLDTENLVLAGELDDSVGVLSLLVVDAAPVDGVGHDATVVNDIATTFAGTVFQSQSGVETVHLVAVDVESHNDRNCGVLQFIGVVMQGKTDAIGVVGVVDIGLEYGGLEITPPCIVEVHRLVGQYPLATRSDDEQSKSQRQKVG